MKLKSILYKKEQDEILDKLINILGLDDNNSTILYELDNDENKQKQILDLLPDIRKYYSLSNTKGIAYPETLKRPWLSIIRVIIKPKYKLISKDHQITKDNRKIRTKTYTFQKK